MHIRLATVADAEAISAIYNYEVRHSTVTTDLVPRTLEAQRVWISERSGARAVIVAEDTSGAVVGFASLSPYRDRPAYATTVESSIYIAPESQGSGIGKALLTELIKIARSHGFHTVIARVVDGHEPSLGLHKALGFKVIGTEVQVARKFGRWLDMVTLQKML